MTMMMMLTMMTKTKKFMIITVSEVAKLCKGKLTYNADFQVFCDNSVYSKQYANICLLWL